MQRNPGREERDVHGSPLEQFLVPKDVMDVLCPSECQELWECRGCKILCATKVPLVPPACFSRIPAASSPWLLFPPALPAVLYSHFPFSVFSSHKLSPVLGNVKHLISIPETATGSPRDSIPGQESLTRHFLHSPFLLLPLFPLAAPNFSRSCSLNIIPSISSSCRA